LPFADDSIAQIQHTTIHHSWPTFTSFKRIKTKGQEQDGRTVGTFITIDLFLSATLQEATSRLSIISSAIPVCLSAIQLLIGLLYFLLHLLRLVFNGLIGIRSALSDSDLLMFLLFPDIALGCRIIWQVNGVYRGFALRRAGVTSTKIIDPSATIRESVRGKTVCLSSGTLR